MQRFWRWLCRFAFKRLEHDGSKMPTGVPCHRDPESKCPAFDIRPKKMGDMTDCDGDGHYLCKECRWFSNRRETDYSGYDMLRVGDEWRDGDEYGEGFCFVVGTKSTGIKQGDKVAAASICYKPRRKKRPPCGR